MAHFAVIVIGYNRVDGVERLSRMLNEAIYDEDVDIIFSIDNSGVDTVVDYAKDFVWKHGMKKIRTFTERQGLKRHILQCGDFLHDYEAIAVLEDDVIVSKYYFMYMKAAYEQYNNDNRIAGISMYAYGRNVLAGKTFTPSYTGFDAYFMQFAQSWGQVWLKRQWYAFTQWLQENDNKKMASDDFPKYVSSWSETSWLKYHIKYCFAENKYFVYPYISFTSCFSDAGEHTYKQSNLLQVPLAEGWNAAFHFPRLDDNSAARYDVFFEREGMGKYLQVDEEVCTDIYGMKEKFNSRYVITTKVLNYKCIRSFGLTVRPHENNVVYDMPGQMIYFYDTSIHETNSNAMISNRVRRVEKFKYYYNLYSNGEEQLETTLDKISERVKRFLKL